MLPFLFHHNNSSLTMEASLRLAQRCGLELDVSDGDSGGDGDGDDDGDGDGDEHLSNSTLLVAESSNSYYDDYEVLDDDQRPINSHRFNC